ncbi:MAG: hypothetical protein J6S21_05585, partial [Victivallales bacterium]|nr:hypothetical protein [Victivallales bacterium]
MRKAILLLTLIAFSFTALFAQEQIPENSVSAARIQTLNETIQKILTAQDAEISLDALEDAVLKNFTAGAKELAAAERVPAVEYETSVETAGKKLEADALKKFPKFTYKELTEMALAKYPMYEVGDRVTVVYYKSATATSKVSGVFRGRAGNSLRINSKHVLLSDLKGLSINEGPGGELAKFDAKLNEQYREEWITEFDQAGNTGREAYIKENRAAYEKRQQLEDFITNEKNGYTWLDNQWYSPEELVATACEKAYAIYSRQSANTRMLLHEAQVANVLDQQTMTESAVLDGLFPSAEKILAQRVARERQRKEQLEQQAREEQLKLEREAEEARKAEISKQREAEKAKQLAAEEELRRQQEEKAAKGNRIIKYIAGGLLALLLIGGFIAWSFQRREKDLDVSKFFEGKGKVQQEFWDAANSDPDYFKYVAYL